MTQTAKPGAIFLMGPTAAGKTDLAIALRQKLPVDIISVDSALVYRGLNIGASKPTPEELAQAPHRLIDICDPSESYSVARFVADARREMAEISAAGRIPLLVGGTMMYFRALLEGLSRAPAADPAVRQQIETEAAEKGWPALHAELAEVDPDTASQLHPNHSQRIQRALEVYRETGIPISRFRTQQRQSGGSDLRNEYAITQLALIPNDRQLLHRRIEKRFQGMIASGFEGEVRKLYLRGDLHKGLPALRSVGYRQMWEYLEGNCSFEEMLEKGVVATRQLAKRQLTWLRRWPELQVVWLDNASGERNHLQEILTNTLKFIGKDPI